MSGAENAPCPANPCRACGSLPLVEWQGAPVELDAHECAFPCLALTSYDFRVRLRCNETRCTENPQTPWYALNDELSMLAYWNEHCGIPPDRALDKFAPPPPFFPPTDTPFACEEPWWPMEACEARKEAPVKKM